MLKQQKLQDLFIQKKFPSNIQQVAFRKLTMIDGVKRLTDLSIPSGNRLEALKGKRKGEYSIRINDQWRICFCWENNNATNVAIEDYHK